MEIDPITGLPKELGVWDDLAKEAQRIKVYPVTRKFGKISTVIEGLNQREINVKDTAKQLKSVFACGGTVKDGKIELQGDHRGKIKAELMKLGFPESTIDVK